jgi:hypothetical protein
MALEGSGGPEFDKRQAKDSVIFSPETVEGQTANNNRPHLMFNSSLSSLIVKMQ